MAYIHQSTLRLSAPVSALAFGSGDTVAVGSDDGTLRLYDLPSNKVTKAIRGFDHDISSICWTISPSGEERGRIWIASGRTAYSYDLNNSKIILTLADADSGLDIGEDDEDVLNELIINDTKKFLAFSTDAGSVGVVDLATRQIARTRASHTSICSVVKFIPDRSSELVSGGYDSALLHFDFKQGSLLARFDISSPPPSSGMILSPPFILSTSISQTGLIAASTADGRAWLGGGGDKSSPVANKKKKSRKWEGLRESDGAFTQIGTGPIVASAFTTPTTLLTCSLLGTIILHTIKYSDDNKPGLETTWTSNVKVIEKVNAIAFSGKWLTIGGFAKDGSGHVEVWEVSLGDAVTEDMSKLTL